jgi:hypothetical protein
LVSLSTYAAAYTNQFISCLLIALCFLLALLCTPSQCQKEKFPEGCISKEKIVAFLHEKWIPGFESSTDPHFIEPGAFFKAHRGLAKADRKAIAVAEGALRHKLIEEMGDKKQAKYEQANGLPRDKNGKLPGDYVEHTGPVVESTRLLVSKLANYLLSRPVEAIPVAVRF